MNDEVEKGERTIEVVHEVRENEQCTPSRKSGRGVLGTLVRGLSVAKQCLSETAAISLIAHSNAK